MKQGKNNATLAESLMAGGEAGGGGGEAEALSQLESLC